MFDFGSFPTLETARLTLRAPIPGDTDDILVFRGDPEVQRFNGPLMDKADIAAMLDLIAQAYAEQQGITWAVVAKPGSQVVGLFGIHNLDFHHRRGELGYDLARSCWGRGYASEGLGAIIGFAFRDMDLHRLFANTIADNTRSVGLLVHLGFKLEGIRRRHSLEDDGEFHDSAIYGLLRDEHAAVVSSHAG